MVWKIILITALTGIVGTGIGALIASFVKRDSNRLMSLLLSFACGVTLGIVCFDFISGAIHSGDNGEHINIVLVIATIFVGYAAVFLLDLLIEKKAHHGISHQHCCCCEHEQYKSDTEQRHPKHSHSSHHEHHKSEEALELQANGKNKLISGGIVMAIAIAMHNLPVGMVIGASCGASATIPSTAIAIAFAVAMHNIPEGMTVSAPLISGGMKRSRAIIITLLSGAPTIIGGLIGYRLGTLNSSAHALMLSFAAGAMLFVLLCELIPEALGHYRSKLSGFAMLIGLLVSILIVFTHSH